MNKDSKKVTYVLEFTYFSSDKQETMEMSKTELSLFGLEKETSDINYYDLQNLIRNYEDKDGKATIRKKFANGELSDPIEHSYFKPNTEKLDIRNKSLFNAFKRNQTLESEILEKHASKRRIY